MTTANVSSAAPVNATPKIVAFEIINHGWDHAQYFQGCGTSFTPFAHCVTGAGMNAVEAYHDALEQIWTGDASADALPKRPRGLGITLRNKVPATHMGEDSEFYSYVSIRYSTDADKVG